jgi:hypothetical protein
MSEVLGRPSGRPVFFSNLGRTIRDLGASDRSPTIDLLDLCRRVLDHQIKGAELEKSDMVEDGGVLESTKLLDRSHLSQERPLSYLSDDILSTHR